MGSTSIIDNMGVIFLVIILIIVVGVLLLALKVIIRKFQAIQKIYTKIHQMIFFSSFLRAIQKGYLGFAIATLISLQNFSKNIEEQILSSVVGFILLVTPIATLIFFRKFFNRLSDTEFQLRFGSLYLNLKTYFYPALRHTILYFLRRLIYAGSIVFLSSQPAFQFILFVTSSLVLLAFQWKVQPMEDRTTQTMEIYNESTIMVVGCLMAPYSANFFTAETSDASYTFGWIMIGLVLLNVAINQGVMVVAVLQLVISTLKGLYKKTQNRLAQKTPISFDTTLDKCANQMQATQDVASPNKAMLDHPGKMKQEEKENSVYVDSQESEGLGTLYKQDKTVVAFQEGINALRIQRNKHVSFGYFQKTPSPVPITSQLDFDMIYQLSEAQQRKVDNIFQESPTSSAEHGNMIWK